jgi:hypothetical protein
MKYVGKLDRVLLIRVILPPLDKYNIFQQANRSSIFSIVVSPYMLGLIECQRYFKGKDATPQPKTPASPATFSTYPTGTNSDLAKLAFKPDTASNNKNKLRKSRRWFGLAPQKSKVSLVNRRLEISVSIPTKKPDNKTLLIAAEIILPNASITMTNSKGDKKSTCLKPRKLLKKLVGEPFTKRGEPH